MGPTWDLSTPDGPHVDPMSLAIRDVNKRGLRYPARGKLQNPDADNQWYLLCFKNWNRKDEFVVFQKLKLKEWHQIWNFQVVFKRLPLKFNGVQKCFLFKYDSLGPTSHNNCRIQMNCTPTEVHLKAIYYSWDRTQIVLWNIAVL